jgi:hypothetical protein
VSSRTPAKAYDVKVTNTETGEVAELDAVKDGSTRTDRVADAVDSGTARFLVPSSALKDGTYRFQVRAISEAGRVTSWSGLSPAAVVDTASPGLALQTGSGFVGNTALTLHSSEPLLSVSSSNLGVRGPSGVVAGTLVRISATSFTFRPNGPWVTGGYYTAWTTAKDRAGKTSTVTSAPRRAGTTADSSGTALTYASGDRSWTTRTASSAYGKSYRSTKDDGRTSRRAYVAATVYGTSVTVGTCKSPTSGSLQVWVDGRLRTTTKLYRSYTGCGVTVSVKGLAAARHAIKLVAVAYGSRGDVAVDRMTVA